ncbi:MAG: KEOPS complex subunit Pcc1 [Candidatus Hodarchaeota archaeon]
MLNNKTKSNEFKICITTEIKLDKPEGKIVQQAIKPETEAHISDRSKTTIELLDPKTIRLTVYAQDYVSAKAALNTFGRWIALSCTILKVSSLKPHQ